MSTLFAMIAEDHSALMDVYTRAQQHFSVSLVSQHANCLMGQYSKNASDVIPDVQRVTYGSGELVLAAIDNPPPADLEKHIAADATAISLAITGGHTALLWQPGHGRLIASRDPLNQHSLYCAHVNGVTIVSTEASFIARILPNTPSLSSAALACWLAGQPNPALCLYEGIKALPIGCAFVADISGAIEERCFWDIDPAYTLELGSDAAYTAAFAELLEEVVQSYYSVTDQVMITQMSGGMDSTSITALVNNALKGSGRECRALSHLYSHSQSCDESENIKAMQRKLDLKDPIEITVDAGAHRDFLSLYPTDFDSPGTVLSPRYHQECQIMQRHWQPPTPHR